MSIAIGILAWAVIGLFVFLGWYVLTRKPSQWQIWTMGLLCGPFVFLILLDTWLIGGEL